MESQLQKTAQSGLGALQSSDTPDYIYWETEQSDSAIFSDNTLQKDLFILSGGGGNVTPPSIGINNAAELKSGLEWGPGGGVGVNLTYSFITSVPTYYPLSAQERVNFSAFTVEMQDAARTMLSSVSTFANINFTEVSGVGNITFGQALLTTESSNPLAWGYYPDGGSVSGDIWFNNAYNLNPTMGKGEQGYYALLHEVGHALGLIHSFDAGLTGAENTEQYTVMAYDRTPWGSLSAQTHMLYDISALQAIYGANTTYNNTDTTYNLNPNAALTIWDTGGSDLFDSTAVSSGVTIHLEEGGYSSIGLTNNIAIAYGTTIENATSGAGNDFLYGNEADNILNSGAGNDLLQGGAGNDRLEGGIGNDDYYYLSGDDVLAEDGGTDILHLPEDVLVEHVAFLRYSTEANNLVIHVDDADGDPLTTLGTITIENQFLSPAAHQVETLRFFPNFDTDLTNQRITTFGTASDDTILGITFGANPDDTLFGFDGADTLNGGDGDDTLYGNTGNDHLVGGIGGDALFGNEDDDILDGGAGNDFLFGDRDDNPGSELFSGNDILNGGDGDDWIEGNKGDDSLNGGMGSDILLGNEGDDILLGNEGDDFLSGDVGADFLNGGAGVDALYGGADSDTFFWDSTALGSLDTVYDFSVTDGDILDISSLLTGYDALTSLITDFVQITDNGVSSFLAVDGDGGADNFVQLAILNSATGLTDENFLETNGNLMAI